MANFRRPLRIRPSASNWTLQDTAQTGYFGETPKSAGDGKRGKQARKHENVNR
jgi:hypothetical protein